MTIGEDDFSSKEEMFAQYDAYDETTGETFLPRPCNPVIDCLIIDTEGITLGTGGTNRYVESLAIYTEVAVVHVHQSNVELIYHKQLSYDIEKTLESYGDGVRVRGLNTYRASQKCALFPMSNPGGTDIGRAREEVRSIIGHFSRSGEVETMNEPMIIGVWAKGPAMECRFLSDAYDRPAVIRREKSFPIIQDLREIGCPKFEMVSKEIRTLAEGFVEEGHYDSFHLRGECSDRSGKHCCAMECVAFGKWLLSKEWHLH